jgi:hypothetical protein
MSIIRTEHNKENPYVMLNKSPLSDRNLSWAAKGLWAFLISKKDDWQVSVAHLSKIFLGKGGGRDAIYSLLDELIEQGYCEKKGQSQNTKGQFSLYEYVIYEFKIISPLTGSPDADEPDTDRPDTAEQATSNKPTKPKNEFSKETTQQESGSGCSSDSEKVEALAKFPLNKKTIEKSLFYSLDEIKLAIECCLNATESINNIDGYFMSALKEKWHPKPSKEKIAKLEEDAKEQQKHQRQKIYTEAKQLQSSSNLKEGYRFTVENNRISVKDGKGWCSLDLTEEGLECLKYYIRKNSK